MRSVAHKIVERERNKRRRSEEEVKEIKLRTIYKMISGSFKMKVAKQEDVRQDFLRIFKALTL